MRAAQLKVELRTVQKVDDTMAAINEQRELANEIADTISQPFGMPFEDVSPQRFLRRLLVQCVSVIGRDPTRIGRTGTRDTQ